MHPPALRTSAVSFLWVVLTLFSAAAAATGATAPSVRPITHEDLWLMKRPGALAVSPDGRWFVVAVTEPAYEDGQSRSDLWIVSSDGIGPLRRLTSGKGSEGDPVFSPDSTRLAFTARRDEDEASQIYVLDLAGGEAQRVTNWPGGAKAPKFSPDGRSILFVGLTHPGALTEEDNRKAATERKARKYNARAYDSFPVRHWDRWLDELRPSVMVQAIGNGAAAWRTKATRSMRCGRRTDAEWCLPQPRTVTRRRGLR